MKNIISINLILNDLGVTKFKRIPTFKDCLHPNQVTNLVIGNNELNVNKYIFSKLERIIGYDPENMKIQRI